MTQMIGAEPILETCLIFIGCSLCFIVPLLSLYHTSMLRSTESLHLDQNSSNLPKVSFCIPACNEESTIGAALASFVNIDYPNYELVVVNDRSSDGTRQVIESYSDKYDYIRLLNIDSLPEGWLGKTHALHQASGSAEADFLIFCDADVHLSKTIIRRLVDYVEKESLDYLTIVPQLSTGKPSYLLSSIMLEFELRLMMSLNPGRLRNPDSNHGFGVGAFMMVRQVFWRQTKGFEAVKLDVIDDLALGSMLKHEGARSDVFQSNYDDVAVDWYSTVHDMVKGLEKNLFAAFAYNVSLTIFYVLIEIISFGVFLYGVVNLDPIILSCFCFYFCMKYILIRRTNFSPLSILYYPLAQPIYIYLLLNSAIVTLRSGGVRWRDSFYPLPLLQDRMSIKLLDFLLKKK